jgi:hypothetical protein
MGFTWLGDAISERQRSIYSSAFYSGLTGYKMCLRIYLNGDADARGTHLSLFLVIMRGKHDNKLQWPLSGKITFTVLDQTTSNGSDDVTRELWSTHASGCFSYPESMMNNGYGIKRFVCLEHLEQRWHSYVKDDALRIRVAIDLLSSRPGKNFKLHLSLENNTLLCFPSYRDFNSISDRWYTVR